MYVKGICPPKTHPIIGLIILVYDNIPLSLAKKRGRIVCQVFPLFFVKRGGLF